MGRIGLLARVFVFLIRVYQKGLSPFFPRTCRFFPSCSQYGIDAIRHFGALKGAALLLLRLFKCHPFHSGGVDYIRRTGV